MARSMRQNRKMFPCQRQADSKLTAATLTFTSGSDRSRMQMHEALDERQTYAHPVNITAAWPLDLGK